MKKLIFFCIIFAFVYFIWEDLGSSSPDITPAPAQAPVASVVPDLAAPINTSTSPVATYTPAFTPSSTPGLTTTAPITPDPDITSTPVIPSSIASSSLKNLYEIMENPSSEIVSREYQWTYGWKQWTWSLHIPQAAYDYYKALPRPPTANYSIYVTHPLDDPYINNLVEELQKAAKEEGYNEYETISFTASFVQSLNYTIDAETEGYDEYPRYPVETLFDRGGDCEDTSILLASLINSMGYGVVLLFFPETADSSGHCAVGVAGAEGLPGYYWKYNDRNYYYIETTGKNWQIGDVPEQYQQAYAKIYPMVPVPILVHDWNVAANGIYAQINVTVDNLGTIDAQGVYVLAGFDAGNDQVWNQQLSPEFNLGVNESKTVTLNLIPPIGEHTRIIVQIIYNGYAVDESYSKWFDT